MSEALRFELLGPQRAWHADRPIDLGPAKQRAVLAVLLLSAGRPVRTGQIVEAVWPEEAPVNGANVVQKHVAGLRRVLEPDRSPRTPARVLTLTDAGYVLRVTPEAVDAARFERGVQRARQAQAAGRTAEALTDLDAALELWQGEPFTGFTGPWFDAARHRLVELRAVALETRTELELAAGRHDEAVGRLVELTAEFPVRERLRLQLMLALHRSGRQAEALAAYRDFAALLRDDYGIEPGEPLQDLHRRILRSDPGLLPPPRAAAEPGAPVAPTRGGTDRDASPPPVPSHPAPSHPTTPADSAIPVLSATPIGPAPPGSPVHPLSPAQPAGPVHLAPAYPGWPSVGPHRDWPPVPPAARPHRGVPGWISIGVTVLGALVAVFSFGLLTWLVVGGYAIWRRSWGNAVAAGYYLILGVAFVVIIGSSETEEVSDAEGVLIFCWLITWVAGVLHVVLLNGRFLAWVGTYRRRGPAPAGRLRREHARYLLYHYPTARGELRIGRPDLPRGYDDGGLVDVNSVADETLVGLPGLSPGQAQHLVLDRRVRGPYTSMEELAARCLLPPAVSDPLREVLLFLPPEPPPGPPATPAAPGRNA
ncbi:BTAD domain-containing putative transcriptional regulator [Micromonospora sp. NPDC051300]|uniref:BTAD domain-containing putative transcriptional regulator n=1 Tax=Micromonospora sp. NPDC051300 TaxID=3364286 RepID=UPI003788CC66